MSKRINLVNQKYGRLLVISEIKNNKKKWLCRCDCGSELIVYGSNMKRGLTQSCGCLSKEMHKKRFTKHGATIGGKVVPEYKAWGHMKDRCYNENNDQYKDWGGRGIKVCDRWLGDKGYENFLSDMGPKPTNKHSIDRYPDVNGNYEPSNCRWGTKKEQGENTRRTKWIEYNGEKLNQRDWSKRLKVCEHTVARFLKTGKTIGDIMEKYKHRQTVS